jgi:hypothetical protein
MGLLDEAIRQHLELKRRHGADPSEVARQEQEALGPPRRGTAAEEAELADDTELAVDETELYDDEDELADDELADDELYEDEDEDDAPRFASEPPRQPEPEPEPEPEAPVASVDQPTQAFDVGDLEAADRDAGAQAEEDAEEDAGVDEPRRPPENRAEPGADAEDSEDVLEETPEFLQETPEHDRLWFEQKPPRDFDF